LIIELGKFLKESNLDYAHGTGHGVGFFLNVHEGPQSISKINKVKIKQGMILSNEPGYYKKNNYGIRIENLVYVNKKG
jgi:Xaa-Pro aminopeptidase